MAEREYLQRLADIQMDQQLHLWGDLRRENALQRRLREPEDALSDEQLMHFIHVAENRLSHWQRSAQRAGGRHTPAWWVQRISAGLIVALLIAMPVTYAASATFRAAVGRMFVDANSESDELILTYTIDRGEVAVPPEGWTGAFYPTWLPKEVTLVETNCDTDTAFAAFAGEGYTRLYLQEFGQDGMATNSTENATVRYIRVQGQEAVLIEGAFTVSIYVVLDDWWICVTGVHMDTAQVQRVAESMSRPILP